MKVKIFTMKTWLFFCFFLFTPLELTFANCESGSYGIHTVATYATKDQVQKRKFLKTLFYKNKINLDWTSSDLTHTESSRMEKLLIDSRGRLPEINFKGETLKQKANLPSV